MKQIKHILLLWLFISTTCTAIHAQENVTYFIHTVESGQTLYSIANMYKVSEADIIKLNPGSENTIRIQENLKIPLNKDAKQQTKFHTIKVGDTLYNISKRYGIPVQNILNANPGLSEANFQVDKVIQIPVVDSAAVEQQQKAANAEAAKKKKETRLYAIPGAIESRCKEMHKVKRHETVYSLSKKYHISEEALIAANPEIGNENDGGLKKGKRICIPYSEEEEDVSNDTNYSSGKDSKQKYHSRRALATPPPSDTELFKRNKATAKPISPVKAAIILPFKEDRRMIEYYQGFLIAVDSLKHLGRSFDIYTYNCTNNAADLDAILSKAEMKNMNIIFGPAYQNQITPLANFAKKNKIRLVIPFSSKASEVFTNPYIYQINTPQSYLYSEVYRHFLDQFPSANVVFIKSNIPDTDKNNFISGFKRVLASHRIPMQTVNEGISLDSLKATVNKNLQNIYIPTSSGYPIFNNTITKIVQLSKIFKNSEIHLFGYPEWQTYTKSQLNNFFNADTYFYTTFYTNSIFPESKDFTNKFCKWYGHDMSMNYPKYGMLGFDTGFFFLDGLSVFGSALEDNVHSFELKPVQNGMKFMRVNNWGGFINQKIFFINFTRSFTLSKIDLE
ncbi:MAG: LysM peptidoglycan-binding domain-containing protein [Bacteroidaceae bacterium]|nr:LysM peptidoglycan-binding domain-containing protein [Bacteroidaceae bacterium]